MAISSKDAQLIADVLKSADGYCTECARDLAIGMTAVFPEHPWRKLIGEEDDES